MNYINAAACAISSITSCSTTGVGVSYERP